MGEIVLVKKELSEQVDIVDCFYYFDYYITSAANLIYYPTEYGSF